MNVVASYRLLIPAVKTFRLIACLVALLACSPLVQAQTDKDEEVIEAPPVETTDNVETKIGTLPAPPEFRLVPDSTVHRYQKEEDFAYANDPAYWNLEREREMKEKREKELQDMEKESAEAVDHKKGFWDHFNDLFAGGGIRTFIYFILALFFVFVIYRLMVVNNLFYFSKKVRGGAAAHTEAADIEDGNLDEKIRKAIVAGEYRQAVRYMYLKSLQLLNEKEWIKFHADATNYEYVIQMSKHKLGNDFGFLTRIYDYVWYGEFILSKEQFEIVHNNFSHFYNAVNS
ncbi:MULTISPECIES: hypothetical protein [Niastella]|uniref:DUF4129 domain-containing protein n=1 Tax=Niastella soli TaxID=2821487 RepID=A0ABS3YV76_9BACT|nr:hypothetical protein [Niastella soli]MBO9201831.1 hypothetical protein [Niastella soli]